ncbi:symmetrical bis(5'-nucleosyl)-tetraphosphatase [Bowmanella dokdonensis]|uniref:bis(5'-nucleosyl)-tetraphosphatase (symmetrical) n=1 Tax=Bowmanella dokdonensis TaxID=751969 RepID=A0A939IMP6_9ALTE|nr:symmetrical bis(5'-nucleosyl)-tetraphosphatase [Bowmanella dokdonensis]MBN7825523.1 symmetrical bis(5'-nucleosyl)-tetraphosphatase [Bowmanella dokdonensis]
MTTYVVGDIQGCYSALQKLLEQVDFQPGPDKLWAAGDLVGRGTEALQTLRFLSGLGEHFNTVLGNHDLHCLAVHCGIRMAKESDKLADLLAAPDRDELIDWLRHRPVSVLLDERTFLSHAGLYPGWSFHQALDIAGDISQTLQGRDWQQLLQSMYGNEAKAWSDVQSTMDKQVFGINAFTRMRYVNRQGQLDLKVKSALKDAPSELYPWFRHPALLRPADARIIFGHWAALQGVTGDPAVIALDTGYIWGGKLTAYALESGEFFQFSR